MNMTCNTSSGAICGLCSGKMLSGRKIRKIFIEIIRELVAVADKMSIQIEVFGGRLEFREFISREEFFPDLKKHLMIWIIGFICRLLKSSNLQSPGSGQSTEIDYLNRHFVRNGMK